MSTDLTDAQPSSESMASVLSEEASAPTSILHIILSIRGLPVAQRALTATRRWAAVARAAIRGWNLLRSTWSLYGVRLEEEWIGHRTDDNCTGDFDMMGNILAVPEGGFLIDDCEGERMQLFEPVQHAGEADASYRAKECDVPVSDAYSMQQTMPTADCAIVLEWNHSSGQKLKKVGPWWKKTQNDTEQLVTDSSVFVLGGKPRRAEGFAVHDGTLFVYVPEEDGLHTPVAGSPEAGADGGWLVMLDESTLALQGVVEDVCAAQKKQPDRPISLCGTGIHIHTESQTLFLGDTKEHRVLVYSAAQHNRGQFIREFRIPSPWADEAAALTAMTAEDRAATLATMEESYVEEPWFKLALGVHDDLLVLSGNCVLRLSLEGVLLQKVPIADWSANSLCVGRGASAGLLFIGCDQGDDALNCYGYADESVHVMRMDCGITDEHSDQAMTQIVTPNEDNEICWEVEGGNMYGWLGGSKSGKFGQFLSGWIQRTIEHAWQNGEQEVDINARGELWRLTLRGPDDPMTAKGQGGMLRKLRRSADGLSLPNNVYI